jgi:CHAT domain-containing protein/tetratricopeptide (TPR) repeat protein
MTSLPRARFVLTVVSALASLGLQKAPVPTEPAALVSGSRIERLMKAGEEHRYRIDLSAGEYVQALVEQQGVDVEEAVLGPDGKPVLEMDSFSAEKGPEPLAFVAHTSGAFVLVVRGLEGDAPTARYLLHVEAVRAPSEADLLRVRTAEATGRQARLYATGKPKEAREALDRGRQAVLGWRTLGERRLEMYAELGIGVIHRVSFGEYREAKLPLERALAAAREIEEVGCLGQALFNLASTTARLGLFGESQAYFEEALALHRKSGRRAREAYMLMPLGRMLVAAGDPQQGLERLQEALGIFEAVGDDGNVPDTRALARVYMGDAYLELSEHELALAEYRRARSLLGAHDRRDVQVQHSRALTGMGTALVALRDVAGARSAYEEALAIARKLGHPGLQAEATSRLGELLREGSDLAGARKLFASALEVFRSAGDPLGGAGTQCRLGEIHRRLGELAVARSAFVAALGAAPRLSVSVRACAQQGLARLAVSEGRLEAARAHAEAALEAAESFRASVASHRTRAATLAAQQSLYELLIDIHHREHEADPLAGHDAAALEVSERARARSLLELLAEGRVQVRQGVERTLLEAERSLRQRLNADAEAQEEALASGRRERAEALDREILALTTQLAEVQDRIRRASPRYAALTQPRPLRLAEIQRDVLDDDTVLLEYALGEARSLLWVVSRDTLATVPLASRSEIESAAASVHETLSQPTARSAGQIERLSDLVLPAAARKHLTRKRLLVVAPGALQYVPFGALRLPDSRPLLARFEVVSAPSASVIATLRAEPRERRAARTVAVFADPVFEASDPRVAVSARRPATAGRPQVAARDLPRALRDWTDRGGSVLSRLPFSRQEAAAIRSLAPPGAALLATGFAASRESVTAPGVSDYRILHFATHGVLNTRHPDLSGVVLSLVDREGRRQDGFLRLHEIYNLDLGAELVVLSGCQTGLGKALRGEGLIGLTRGFMYAGAERVVASLWRVDDESTAELMKHFYRAMLKDGQRPAEALRSAQLRMSQSRRWSAPFYWAGFVLQGDWR